MRVCLCVCVQATIQALQLLKNERDRKKRSEEESLREKALMRGEDPNEAILRRKREMDESKKRTKFEKNRRKRHVEIVSRLLQEEKARKRSEKMAAKPHWQGRWTLEGAQQIRSGQRESHHRPKPHQGFKNVEEDILLGEEDGNPTISGNEADPEGNLNSSDDDENKIECEGGNEGEGEGRELGETLAEPEINGLWSLVQEADQHQLDNEEEEEKEKEKGEGGEGRGGVERVTGKRQKSKLEQKKMSEVVDSLRKSIARKQVAAGREFKVSP